MSTLGAAHLYSLTLTGPQFGDWSADVTLEGGDVPAVGARMVLTVGDLALSGVVVNSGEDNPGKPHAWLQGAPGWAALVTAPLSFQSDAGVRLSTVLSAISSAAGQPIEQPADTTLDPHYELVASRPGEPVRYRDAIAALIRDGAITGWRVDPDGVTRFGARPAVEVSARATVMRSNPAIGLTVVGLDAPAGFLPGATLGGVPIARLVVHETSGKLTADLYATEAAGALPTPRASIQRIVAAMIDERVRTYVVAAVRGDKRLDLVPPPDAQHLPEMAAVEQWSLGGALVTPAVGAQVLVLFRDSRRGRPIVVGFGPGAPTRLDLGGADDAWNPATEAGRVVRYGDQIVFPVGAAGTPTALPITGVALPPITSTVSRVRA